jgi:hypothetical protein
MIDDHQGGKSNLLARAMDEIFGTHSVASVMNLQVRMVTTLGAIRARYRLRIDQPPSGCQQILAGIYLRTSNGGR